MYRIFKLEKLSTVSLAMASSICVYLRVWVALFCFFMDYGSQRWKDKRARILRRDKYLCQISKRYGKLVPANLVHHIFPAEDFPEYEWCDWNLISISLAEHNKLHDRDCNDLTPAGKELLLRTARKNKINIPPGYGL